MRLNRFLASAGLGSRRAVEQIILEGRVRINGQVVTDLATQVTPTDAVKVGSRLLRMEQPIHAIMHKPKGFVCSADDEKGRRTIFDLLPKDWPRVFNVGRLDMDSEGILLVTNDGDLTHQLTHPSHEVEKEYEVLIDRPFNPLHREKMLRGFRIQSGYAKCEKLDILKPNHLRLVLRQGLNRQIRLMLFDVGGYEVERLMRVRFGTILLKDLQPGNWRFLTGKEVASLREASAQPSPNPVRKSTRAPRRSVVRKAAPRAAGVKPAEVAEGKPAAGRPTPGKAAVKGFRKPQARPPQKRGRDLGFD